MGKILLIICLIIVTSCAHNQTLEDGEAYHPVSSSNLNAGFMGCLYTTLVFGLLGFLLSPDKESQKANVAVFGSLGCAAGGAGGYYYSRLKEQEELNKMGGDLSTYRSYNEDLVKFYKRNGP